MRQFSDRYGGDQGEIRRIEHLHLIEPADGNVGELAFGVRAKLTWLVIAPVFNNRTENANVGFMGFAPCACAWGVEKKRVRPRRPPVQLEQGRTRAGRPPVPIAWPLFPAAGRR
jgi:hypothetical protein